MSKDSSQISRSLIALSLVLFTAVWLSGANRMTTPVQAQTQGCASGQTQLTVMTGNGTVCNPDSQIQFFDGANFVPAFVVNPNTEFDFPYATIPGTMWVAMNCERTGEENAHFTYRATFTLPGSFTAASLTVQVHCDNVATFYLNGNLVGGQTDAQIGANFQDPPESFTTTTGFAAGPNVLTVDVHNFDIITALDFKADICYTPVGCVDEDPPAVSCSVAQTSLWPPNHQLETVGLTASVTDDCDPHVVIGGGPGVNGVAVYSDEQDLDQGSGNFSPDAKNIGLGTLRLRSERGGPFNGRVYLIVVQATDASGKTGYCAKTVTVPHDQSRASKNSVEAQAAAARAFFLANHTPPAGFVQVGVGPVVGPKQ